jgi:hypothetical protein
MSLDLYTNYGVISSELIETFNPDTDTSSTLELWLDASDASTITEAANKVSQWNDKSSGTTRNTTQATGAAQPITNVSTLNGLNVLQFNGAQYISYAVNDLSYQNHTIFVVAKADNTATFQDIYGSGGSLADGDVLLMNASNKYRGHFDTGPSFNVINSVSATVTTPTIYTQDVDGTNITIRRGGVLDNSLALIGVPAANPRGAFVGFRGGSTAFFDGDIAEVLVYNTKLSDDDYNAVGNYLADKWGVSWSTIEFSPSEISNLVVWLDASDAGTITQAANKVSQWNDKSGQGNHVTQGVAASQPTTNTRTINGKNVLDWDGVADFMERLTFTGGSEAQPLTVIVVFEVDSLANLPNVTLVGSTVAQPNFQYLINPNDKLLLATNAGYFSAAVLTTATPTITQTTFNGASSATLRNGLADGTGDAGTLGMNGIRIATERAASPNPGSYFNGAIAEILVYGKALSVQETTDVTDYLKNKWGI